MQKFIILFFLIFLYSCKKETFITSLPQITSTGQNSLGFLVNEKVWVPKWEKYTWRERCRELHAEFSPDRNYFQLSGGIKVNGKKASFRISIDSLSSAGIYTSKGTISFNDGEGMFIPKGGHYDNVCGPNTSFSITITRLDTVNKIVSGVFQATLRKIQLTNLYGQELYPYSPLFIEIKDGLFDVNYNYCR